MWHHLQYVLGLKKLGHEVLFLEWSEDYEACYNPATNTMGTDPNYGLRFIDSTFKHFNLNHNWAYFDEHLNKWYGQTDIYVSDFVMRSDLLVNLSGATSLRPLVEKISIRVFLDTDPLFTQIRHLQNKLDKEIASQHSHHFTFAENINNSSCSIPQDGFEWKTTRQPIVLDAWKEQKSNPTGSFTTVMQWDSYKTRKFKDIEYGMKSKSFSVIENVPKAVPEIFMLAVGSASAPRKELLKQGWQLLDPLKVTKSAFSYQMFILNSKAEFTVAKHGYAASQTGWFSERSAAYLACGRPVITQETGFSDFLPVGLGLLAFSSFDEALNAINELNADYRNHCHMARKIAEEYFDSAKVLTEFLQKTC